MFFFCTYFWFWQKDFFKPMLSRAKKSASFISVDDVNALFGNIEALESFHMAFITRFQQFLNNNISSYTIGQFFMEMVMSISFTFFYLTSLKFTHFFHDLFFWRFLPWVCIVIMHLTFALL